MPLSHAAGASGGAARGVTVSAYPKIPMHLSTVRAGDRSGRWRERRAILVAQRDIRQRWYARLTELAIEGAPVSVARRNTGAAIDTLNRRIDECNEALDALAALPAAHLRPGRDSRRARSG